MNASSLNLGGGPPSSSLDLSNNKAKTSSLDLGGGDTSHANATNTRSTRRNKADEQMAVDEEKSEEEEDEAEKPQVLDGFTLVVSGIFSEITREKLEALISEYGGRVTGSVSGKTDYLVVGYKLEDGREVTLGGKYRNATAKKKPILDEAGF